jgi:hypothetical protein
VSAGAGEAFASTRSGTRSSSRTTESDEAAQFYDQREKQAYDFYTGEIWNQRARPSVSPASDQIPEAHRLKSITYGYVDLWKEPLKLVGHAVWDIIVMLAPEGGLL